VQRDNSNLLGEKIIRKRILLMLGMEEQQTTQSEYKELCHEI